MHKINLAVIYGGNSSEHDISIMSAKNIIKNVNFDKYNLTKIMIDKKGIWYEVVNDELYEISNLIEYIRSFDIVFPVLHGNNGEDGNIQGFLNIIGIPYVGCKTLASSVAFDKHYTKTILKEAGIKTAKWITIRKINNEYHMLGQGKTNDFINIDDIDKLIIKYLNYPVFIKPCSQGSSIGVSKVHKKQELEEALDNAFSYDDKIIIEETIRGKELECAILDDGIVKASCVGEIVYKEDFYSYDSKYKSNNSNTLIPANIPDKVSKKIKKIAIKSFNAILGNGIARIDFFYDEVNNDVYLNEINTMPGFTDISMYPKLWEHDGITTSRLIDKLIDRELSR